MKKNNYSKGYVCKDVKLKAFVLVAFILFIIFITIMSILYPERRKQFFSDEWSHRDSISIIYDDLPDNVFESISLRLGDNCADSLYVNEYLNNKAFYDAIPYDEIRIRP